MTHEVGSQAGRIRPTNPILTSSVVPAPQGDAAGLRCAPCPRSASDRPLTSLVRVRLDLRRGTTPRIDVSHHCAEALGDGRIPIRRSVLIDERGHWRSCARVGP